MNRVILYIQCIAWLAFTGCQSANEKTTPGPGNKAVEVRFQDGRYTLYRFGKPYFIKGVSITDCRNLRKLRETGGNAVRLYSTYNAKGVLDSAQNLGLTVMLGLDLLPSGPKMDYNDENAVNEQFERIKKEVIKYRNYPSLLMWSIGNEVGLNITPGIF